MGINQLERGWDVANKYEILHKGAKCQHTTSI